MKFVGLSFCMCLVASVANAQETAPQEYARKSVGMSLSTGVAETFGGQKAATTMSGFQLNVQATRSNVFLGVGLQVDYAPALHIPNTLLGEYVALGLVMPVSERLALTVKCTSGVLEEIGGSQQMAGTISGTFGAEVFVSRHAYMELYLGGGDIIQSQSIATASVGYSLGVTF